MKIPFYKLSHLIPTLFLSTTMFISQAAIAQIAEHSFKASTSVPLDHPAAQGLQRFSELVLKSTNGKIKIRVFPSAQLGNDVQAQSALQGGSVDFVLGATTTLGGIVKDFAIFDFPFLFDNTREADAVLDGAFGKKLTDKLPDKGLMALGYWENGYRNSTNSKRPITKWEDFGGLKIRTMQSPVLLDVFNNMGANAVPMAFSEVYTALESRAVDAQENPNALIEASKFDDVQKYVSLTRHVYNPFILLFSKKTWDKLSVDEKQLIAVAADEAKTYERRLSRETDGKALVELKRRGMQVNDFSQAERVRMADRSKSVVTKHAAIIGDGLVKELYAEIEKARSQK